MDKKLGKMAEEICRGVTKTRGVCKSHMKTYFINIKDTVSINKFK